MSITIEGVEYEAVQFKPESDGNDFFDQFEPARYCIVNRDTGEVVDDAQGYGYKTTQKAYASFGFKGRHKNVKAHAKKRKKRRNAVRKWVDKHRAFGDALEDEVFQRLKNGEQPFAPADVEALLARFGLECPYSAAELLDSL